MPGLKMPERFSEWNEEMVARHDPEQFHRHPRAVVRWIEGRRVATVLGLLDARAEHRVLDLGCGAGNILDRLAVRARHGVDLSRRMAARARARLGRGAVLLLADAERLPYADGRFDRVLCSSLLSHVLHPERVLGEAWRVTAPGGRLVVSVSNEGAIEGGIRVARALRLDRWLLGRGAGEAEHVYASEYHLHRFDWPALREAAAGLPPERARRRVPGLLLAVHWAALYVKPAGEA